MMELFVEILDNDQDYGRDHFLLLNLHNGRSVDVLPLGRAHRQTENYAYEGVSLLDLHKFADAVNQRLRHLYPEFLHDFVKSMGLLDIQLIDGKVSLYWFMPVSEMSPLRNPLIHKLYALLMIDAVLEDGQYSDLTVIIEDPALEKPVRQLADRHHVNVGGVHVIPSRSITSYRKWFDLMWRWWSALISDIFYWFLIRITKVGCVDDVPSSNSYAIGLTIFPTLWEQTTSGVGWRNRATGDFPQVLSHHGHAVTYVGIPRFHWSRYLRAGRLLRSQTAANSIVFTHALLSLTDLIWCYWRGKWGGDVLRWFKKQEVAQIMFCGMDIGDLVRREFLQEIWHIQIALNRSITLATKKLSKHLTSVACGFYPFEFQPIEKAFTAGFKITNQDLPVIGLQTSIIGQAHLGYHFLAEQVSPEPVLQAPYAPVPDIVATYGTVTTDMLESRLGSGRVVLTGPVRYPYLRIPSQKERLAAEADCLRVLQLEPDATIVLLALPSLTNEAKTIIDWAVETGRQNPKLFYLVRFHYWAVLTDYLVEKANQFGFTRYRVATTPLHDLLLGTRVMVTGTSSVSVEGMVSGCMPVVYRTMGQYEIGPMQDVSQGAFFFTSQAELEDALKECITNGKEFRVRQSLWPEMFKRICSPLDGKAGDRLYEILASRGMFSHGLISRKE